MCFRPYAFGAPCSTIAISDIHSLKWHIHVLKFICNQNLFKKYSNDERIFLRNLMTLFQYLDLLTREIMCLFGYIMQFHVHASASNIFVYVHLNEDNGTIE